MNKHIFVIDDDVEILEVIKILLVEKGYRVTLISETNNIFEAVAKDIPDLILLDIWMSGMDGIEIASTLKSKEQLKGVPIVMISANNEGERLAKEAKVDDFLPKPFDIDDILKIVEKHASSQTPA
ncbi:hypothetical protein A2773_04360 [Candidatus Gottesmanbacteria bacterium RIFCSPHIGHO2_01_FULL_39_10]|uniref:Response regulatory domain-containing protein n=1 Tax=Candidatus Gottesmanbacteria bacterium RIFCSPHIGHO2_01_FULL_39_10 TaxID=1798375 RepID=A0A1F5ZRG5_9BACT|nr:MAG: hypothetical protein A2773_04360 [Candidatus Gottesmanbacteria bacterium RIFCSPHIGHO2_01_FULL_39_10]